MPQLDASPGEPDERGFTDGRLRLLDVSRMAPAEWEAFKRSRLGE
jgi:hypothetical protein